MENHLKIIVWSEQAEEDIDEIFKYYLCTSPSTAQERIVNILQETESLIQLNVKWQLDEIDQRYHRVFVDENRFRILYKEVNEIVLITRVYPTSKNR